MEKHVQNKQWEHVKVFLANNIEPFTCGFCDGEVIKTELLVHHQDENHDNNDPVNLVAMHRGCHTSHHKRGTVYPEHVRNSMAVSHFGNSPSEETRAKISAALKGKPWSEARRAAGNKGWYNNG